MAARLDRAAVVDDVSGGDRAGGRRDLRPALHARDLPATLALVGLGAAVFIAFGYLLAAAKTDEAVQVLVGLPFLVFSMLSGVLVPYWRIPVSVRPVMDTIPLTYLADACAR